MGVKLHGMDFSRDEILNDLQAHINTYKTDLEQDQRQSSELWGRYAAVIKDGELSRIKMLYLEALKDGVSIERARGRAEGHSLNTTDLEQDEEVKTIIDLFN